jgi:uncharacterized protein YkwD
MSPATTTTYDDLRRPAAWQRALALLAAVLVVLAGQSLASPSAAHASTADSSFVARINAERTARGLRAYTGRADLAAVAHAQAARMAAAGRLYHNPNLARDVKNWRMAGENVGVGGDVATLHKAFMASTGHRANILDRDFTEVGVGTVYANGRLWVAEVFRTPARAAAGSHKPATAAKKATHARPTLRYGQRNGYVKVVQRKLHVRATGYFGRLTRAAVKGFQKRHHLRVTGVVDARTWRALGYR